MAKRTSRKSGNVRFRDILRLARECASRRVARVAVAGAGDPIVLEVLRDAVKKGFASPLLFGSEEEIQRIARRKRIPLTGCTIIDADSSR